MIIVSCFCGNSGHRQWNSREQFSEIARPPQGHVKLGVKRFLVSSFSVKLSFVKVPVKLKVKNGLESRENRQNFDHFHSNRDKSDWVSICEAIKASKDTFVALRLPDRSRTFLISISLSTDFRSRNSDRWHCCAQWRGRLQPLSRRPHHRSANHPHRDWTHDIRDCLPRLLWRPERIAQAPHGRKLTAESQTIQNLNQILICLVRSSPRHYLHPRGRCGNRRHHVQERFARHFKHSTVEVNESSE